MRPQSDYAQSPPYVLTFASAHIADQWWQLVQREYPESIRPGPQLFILKSDDMQEQIEDNPKFYRLRNRWFYTPSDGSTPPIPLQDYRGNPVTALQPPQPIATETPSLDIKAIETTLDKLTAMITENTASIRALSVAQSTGLQTMQEINESTSGQIKALADNQASLQAIVDQNASHYIALSNSSFNAQTSVQRILQNNAEQISNLAEGQKRLVTTCQGLMKSIEQVGEAVNTAASDTASNVSLMKETEKSIGTIVNRISPPPRKLNRRVKGVWYEYDDEQHSMDAPSIAPGKNLGGPVRPRKISMLETPPKSPLSARVT